MKICDLGLSELATLSNETSDQTISDHEAFVKDLQGTAQYVAPELITDYRTNATKYEPSFPADVYSFGILFWELLHAPLPTHPLNWDPYRILIETKYNRYRPRIDPALPSIIQSILSNCWETIPTKRPSFKELLVQFELCTGASGENVSLFSNTNPTQEEVVVRTREYSHSAML